MSSVKANAKRNDVHALNTQIHKDIFNELKVYCKKQDIQ